MGVFDDKKFEQLDFVTQITETIESELNGLLARLPDRLEIDISALNSFVGDSRNLSLSVSSVVRFLMQPYRREYNLSWDDERRIEKCFKFEMSPELTLDMRNNTMTGWLHLVKTTATFEDRELQELMGRDGLEAIRRMNWGNVPISRMHEIMELLGGLDKDMKHRSLRKKSSAIYCRLKDIFKNNEWRIRDTGLANKVGQWIVSYLQNGNLAAFTNFCKLKVMTHNNMPIYSVEEEIL